MYYANNITDLIGNTPLIKLNSISQDNIVLGKCEFLNPTHSIKDRIAKNMILKAIENKRINSETTIIEPTSGNTGIALAAICASLKLKLILVIPSSMTEERKILIKGLGATLVLTDPLKGMNGAIQTAKEINNEIDNSIILFQFKNEHNPEIHKETTAQEILKDTKGKIDFFIAGIGTGGTITGVGETLKEFNPNIKIIAVEPSDSSVLSGGKPGPHKIQGIGAGFIPDVLNTNIYDHIITVSNDEAIETSRNISKNEGLFVGISSGANIVASQKVIDKYNLKNKNIVTILCDTGERYLSTGLYNY